MTQDPEKLRRLVRLINATGDRTERIQFLVDAARRYTAAPEAIATRPYDEQYKVPACESQVYAFAEESADGTLKFHFTVDNPQGISAMAMAVILDETLSNQPLEQVAAVPSDVVYEIFGQELSMGKSMGLMGMVSMVSNYAKKAAAKDVATGCSAHGGTST
jgi:cysteine desulfuration protein SufE